jgi:GINS complex subunit 4
MFHKIYKTFQQVEKNVIHILEQEAARDPDEPARLSPEEFQYAKE